MAAMTDQRSGLDDLLLHFVEDEVVVGPGSGGLGYRESDGKIYWVENNPDARLSNVQVLSVIGAAGISLPGWPEGVPPDWLDQVWQRPQHCWGHKRFASRFEPTAVCEGLHELVARPAQVRLSFILLCGSTQSVLRSLTRQGTKSQIEELWTKAKKLKSASLSPEAKSLRGCSLAETQSLIDKAVARLEFAAGELSRASKIDRPLHQLTSDLVDCFERIFCTAAAGGWKRDIAPTDDADSSYIRFARAYLGELGCNYRPSTVQKALYDWHKTTIKAAQ